MFLRSMLICTAAIVGAVASASAQAPAQCADANFRIYFSHGATTLDADAQRMLEIAERSVAGCGYSELHVRVDGAHARQRGNAILRASAGRSWDVARVEQRTTRTEPVSAPNTLEYAEVVMTPQHLPAGAPVREPGDVGV